MRSCEVIEHGQWKRAVAYLASIHFCDAMLADDAPVLGVHPRAVGVEDADDTEGVDLRSEIQKMPRRRTYQRRHGYTCWRTEARQPVPGQNEASHPDTAFRRNGECATCDYDLRWDEFGVSG